MANSIQGRTTTRYLKFYSNWAKLSIMHKEFIRIVFIVMGLRSVLIDYEILQDKQTKAQISNGARGPVLHKIERVPSFDI